MPSVQLQFDSPLFSLRDRFSTGPASRLPSSTGRLKLRWNPFIEPCLGERKYSLTHPPNSNGITCLRTRNASQSNRTLQVASGQIRQHHHKSYQRKVEFLSLPHERNLILSNLHSSLWNVPRKPFPEPNLHRLLWLFFGTCHPSKTPVQTVPQAISSIRSFVDKLVDAQAVLHSQGRQVRHPYVEPSSVVRNRGSCALAIIIFSRF